MMASNLGVFMLSATRMSCWGSNRFHVFDL